MKNIFKFYLKHQKMFSPIWCTMKYKKYIARGYLNQKCPEPLCELNYELSNSLQNIPVLPSSCSVVTWSTRRSMIRLLRSSRSFSRSDIRRSISSSSFSTSAIPSLSLTGPRLRLSTCKMNSNYNLICRT